MKISQLKTGIDLKSLVSEGLSELNLDTILPGSATEPLHPVILVRYLQEVWPDLWVKLKRYKTAMEVFEHLDVVTGMKTLPQLDLGVACSRWYHQLCAMYRVNGPLEF